MPLGPGEASIAKLIFALSAKLAKMESVLEEFFLLFETYRVERLERAQMAQLISFFGFPTD